MRRLRASAVGMLLLVALPGLPGLLAPTCVAQETIDETQPTRTVSGPAWTNDKLKDRVLMVLFWAARDPKCYPVMAKAAKLDSELGPYGLVVIGASFQLNGMPKADDNFVEAKARALGVRFSVTDGYGFKATRQLMIPGALIFGADGKRQYDGTADQAESKVRALLGNAIVDRATTKTFSKAVQPSVDNLRKGVSPTMVVPRLVALKSDPDAKALVAAICMSAKEQIEEVKERVELDPVGAYSDAQRLANAMKGTPVGTIAGDLFTKLKNDKMVQQELKAQPSLEKVQKLDEALERAMKADPAKGDYSSPEFQKSHQPQISQIRMTAMQMRSSWPKTRATSEASDIAMKYGVMFK